MKLGNLLFEHFFRIQRSYIVQIDQISKLNATSGSRYSVELKTGKSLPAGRTKVADLRKRLLDQEAIIIIQREVLSEK